MICAYSSASAGEITQLRGIDVEQHGDFYPMKLTPEAGTIKTREARTVPLHEHIIAQDFLDFVKTRIRMACVARTAGEGGDRRGSLTARPRSRRQNDLPRPLRLRALEKARRAHAQARCRRSGLSNRTQLQPPFASNSDPIKLGRSGLIHVVHRRASRAPPRVSSRWRRWPWEAPVHPHG